MYFGDIEHEPLLPIRAQLSSIPDGAAGTRATLKKMAAITKAGRVNPIVRNLAVQITSQVSNKDYPREARAVQMWVQGNIRYVRDVVDAETLQTPDVTLRVGAGDCDDQSMLVAALLGSIGHRCRFVAIGNSPGQFAHVFCEVFVRSRQGIGAWFAVETTELYDFGQRPPRYRVSMIQTL